MHPRLSDEPRAILPAARQDCKENHNDTAEPKGWFAGSGKRTQDREARLWRIGEIRCSVVLRQVQGTRAYGHAARSRGSRETVRQDNEAG